MRSKKGAPQESWKRKLPLPSTRDFYPAETTSGVGSYRIGPSGGHGSVITKKPFFLFVDGNQNSGGSTHQFEEKVVEIPLFTTGFSEIQQVVVWDFWNINRIIALKGCIRTFPLSTIRTWTLDPLGGRIWPRRALHVASLETEASTGGKGFNKWEDVHLMWFFRVIFVKISDLEAWRILWITRDDLCGL